MDLQMLTNQNYATLVKVIWHRENARCFNSSLWTVPYIKLHSTHDSGAYYLARVKDDKVLRRGTLGINRSAACCDSLIYLRNTVIHEMIHQEQAQHSSYYIRNHELHGRFFRRRADQICKIIGYDVASMYPKRGTPGFFLYHPKD